MLDSTQLINGLAVLLSFYVGYKFGLGRTTLTSSEDGKVQQKGGNPKNVINYRGDCKMLLIVRNDLKMGKGKIAAQCGHASVGAFETAQAKDPGLLRLWQNTGCAKIALKVESESELMDLRKKAIQHDFNICLIRDAGRTQIEPNTKTVLAIGPAPNKELDKITGHLKLL